MCRVMLCSSSRCAVVVQEKALPDTVLCTSCARTRPPWSPYTALALALVGLTALVALRYYALPSPFAVVGTIVSGALVLLGLAAALMRWQWRARLRRARQPAPRHKS